MRVLVTGATGLVGSAVLERLSGQGGVIVRAAVRQGRPLAEGQTETVVVGDLSADTDWSRALAQVHTIVHTAARVHVLRDRAVDPLSEFRRVNAEATLGLARQAVTAGVRRFVFLSSIKVNGDATEPGRPFTAESAPSPSDPYGLSKFEAEQALTKLASETGLEAVIIRPVLVYGPGVRGNFRALMRWISRGLPLPLASIHNARSLVSLGNLVDLVVRSIHRPEAANRMFLVSDDHDLSSEQLCRLLGGALGRPAKLVAVPVGLLSGFGTVLGMRAPLQRLIGSLQVDIAHTRDALDWHPPCGIEESIEATAKSFLASRTP